MTRRGIAKDMVKRSFVVCYYVHLVFLGNNAGFLRIISKDKNNGALFLHSPGKFMIVKFDSFDPAIRTWQGMWILSEQTECSRPFM